ncbi:MAG: polyprenyl synthetase family protein [Bacteroidales bacterium]|nr:polyprenyl synthetase family protein [Bacteroidales bacterium]MBD5240817.1 polyprenyl synthetase family protein [Barnesiella sp.]MDE5821341.1 polyprenyl synthetase family protein [Paramuribaculum sp.]MDE5837343.1 polyprenyl synthetase family protein [Paramuribaculum sp.]
MTDFNAIKRDIAPELEELRRSMSDALKSSNPLMTKVVEGYLDSKGKLIRPVLVILTAKLLGQVSPKVIESAAAVEMLHNASLIHDDVVDDSKLRRGKPTINSIWDNHIAVLVGDFFVSSALQKSISTGDIRIVESLAKLGKLLSIGEIDQIYNARNHRLDEESYFTVITRKTASLFVSCVEMGGYAVGAPENLIEPMRKYAHLLGLCFQIKDDIFDYFSDEKIGKPTGNDLREGKITLPLLNALSRTDLPQTADMLALVEKDELTASEIATLIQFAKDAGGIDYAFATMKRIGDEARRQLDIFPDSPARKALDDIIAYIINRNI